MRPYGDYADEYLDKGFFPIPARGKQTIKNKHHGRGAPLVTKPEVLKWQSMHPYYNIAARLPRDVIGIDVDAYGSKPGEETLAELEERLGALPETMVSTARGYHDGCSGIRLFRIPEHYWSVVWPGKAGDGIDLIWHGNRYAIVWPSIHPDTQDTYRWYEQYDGRLELIDGIPDLDQIPALPHDWLEYFAKPAADDEQADVASSAEWIKVNGSGKPCEQMVANVDRATDSMADNAHDTARDGSLAIAKDAASGHTGGYAAMRTVYALFREVMEQDRGPGRRSGARSEWKRHMDGAVRRAEAILQKAGGVRPEDPCEAWSGPVRFTRMANPALIAGMHTGAWLNAQSFPPLHFLIPRIVPEGLTLMAGPPKAGKSVLLLRFGLEAARGGTVFGLECEPHAVFYLALEDSERRLQTRCLELLGGEPIPGAFTFQTTIEPGKLVSTVRAWLQKYDSGLVLIDTLGRAMERARHGETQYERDYRLMVSLKEISDAHDRSSVMVSHHSRKSAADDWLDTVSGTNAIAGGCDTIMVINRKRSSEEGILRITGRDVDESEYAMNLIRPTGWQLEGSDLDEAAFAVGRRQSTLGNLSNDIAEWVSAQGDGVRATAVAEEFDLTDGKARTYLNRLCENGHIRRMERGVFGPTRKQRLR